MKWFLYYFVITGLLRASHYFYVSHFSKDKEEFEECIADIAWNTGLKRQHVTTLLYGMCLLFGWVTLPYDIINGIFEIEEEE